MEGLSPLHRRVAGIDVHRMLHVITVLVVVKTVPLSNTSNRLAVSNAT